jgi:hypothetical protein
MLLKNNKIKFITINILLSISSIIQSNDTTLSSLPSPYNSLEAILPFDDHGWYFNGQWIEILLKKNNIKVAIEVGSWLGKSTRHIASLLPENGTLYAVDTWKGSICQQPNNDPFNCAHKVPTLYEQFLSNIIHAKLTHKIIPLRMTSLQASKELASLTQMVDFVYIDAEHDTESVLQDMQSWYPYVSGKRGILCGDDWTWESVKIAVKRFAQIHHVSICAEGNFWVIIENGKCNEYTFSNASIFE